MLQQNLEQAVVGRERVRWRKVTACGGRHHFGLNSIHEGLLEGNSLLLVQLVVEIFCAHEKQSVELSVVQVLVEQYREKL